MTDRKYTHVFRLPLPALNDMFRYRSPLMWLDDLLCTLAPGDFYFNECENPERELSVTASDATLRLICTLLNQHADQSPSDPTPSEEAQRLEDTLAQPDLRALIGERVDNAVGALNDMVLSLKNARFVPPDWLTEAVEKADQLVNGIQDYLADPQATGADPRSPRERQASAEFIADLLTGKLPRAGQQATGKRMLTVGEFREATKDDDPDRLITFYDGAWYKHLEIINEPARITGDSEPTVILAATDEFDTRFDL